MARPLRKKRLALFGLLWLVGVQGAWLAAVRAQAGPDAGAAEPGATPQAYRPAPSPNADAGPREYRIEAERGAEVLRVPVEGTIDLGLAASIRRALEERGDAVAVVLDVNTLGGRVDAAIQIRDALLASPVKTVAYVDPRAISAGALISLACDVIAVTPGASIGAATPIQVGAEGGAQPVEEKMVSYFRTEMRATAEAKGRRGDIAEAMVDNSVAIEGLVQAGKLLTLDTEAALKWNIADLKARSFGGLLDQLGLENATVRDHEETWAEAVVRFLTDPVVSGLLMSLGTLGLLIELYSPGVGLPGIVGLMCILAFFGGHLLVHLAGFEEILLFLLGLGLIALEVFVIPGFGVAGVAGLACLFISLMLTLVGLPLDVTFSTGAWVNPLVRVTIALIITGIGVVLSLRFLPKTRAGRPLVLQAATYTADGFASSRDAREMLDQTGTAQSDLRPVGIASIGGTRIDVVSEGEYIARGTPVRVVKIEGARIVVRAEPQTPSDEA